MVFGVAALALFIELLKDKVSHTPEEERMAQHLTLYQVWLNNEQKTAANSILTAMRHQKAQDMSKLRLKKGSKAVGSKAASSGSMDGATRKAIDIFNFN
eukprot:5710672-Lingulodinium_polyedra.AAC.1